MNLEDRITSLEKSRSHWKLLTSALALGITSAILMAQSRPASRNMTLDKLVIQDQTGKERITLETFPDGTAGITITDERGRDRIMIASLSEKLPAPAGGHAHAVFLDADDHERILLGTSNKGWATVTLQDRDGKQRITSGTSPDGKAVTLHFDTTGKVVSSSP